MTFNTFGHLFRFTSWGESHGEAIGCVVDGVPSLIDLCEDDIQVYLDKRKPAQSRYTTQRQEGDKVKILSGVFEGKTTGTPISLIIHNEDQFRPGHADYTYLQKYGIRDYRGGGRSSARETAMRVAAGAIARKILGHSVTIYGSMIQMGDDRIDNALYDDKEIDKNPFWCADAKAAARWAEKLDAIRKSGSSVGAVIEVIADGIPAGFGAPIYKKLDADIAAAMMSINAVKGVEIGDGFASALLNGESNADCMRSSPDGKAVFTSNHAGGILGGISTGQPIVARFAVKPTSSILNEVDTIDIHGNNTTIQTKGRHDPCVGIRAVPVGEAMLACVLADHYLMYNAFKRNG
jgi:chorismate synthase